MTADLVSIMMPAFNAEKHIAAAIESVLAQTYPNWELIIINDGSTDRTQQIASSYPDRRIQVFEQANSGEAAARNHALSRMQGTFYAFLDSDDKYLPEFVESCVNYLKQHPDRNGVYTNGVYIDPEDNPKEQLSAYRRGPFEGDLFEPLVRASDVFGPPICVMLHHSVVTTRRLQFDTRIIIGPDWDFFTRLASEASFGYLDEVLVHYRVHTTNITVTTGSQKRRESLAICRENAIHQPRFPGCSLETRVYAFYDLLINLLTENPERQKKIVNEAQFQQLPKTERARLFRLMASRAIIETQDSSWAIHCLNQACHLSPSDPKSQLLRLLYRLTPGWTTRKLRERSQPQRNNSSPFGEKD